MIVDAQVHAWASSPTSEAMAASDPRDHPGVDGERMVAAMDAVGVDGAVLVSPWRIYRTDTTYAESVYRDHPSRFGLVAPIDPAAVGVAERIAEWAATPGAIGIRLLSLPDHPLDEDNPGVATAVNGAAAAGMPVNVMCWGRISLMDELARRFPDAQFVLDHLGLTQPMTPPAPDDPFDDLPQVLALAQYDNVALKVTGACTYSHRPFPYDDLWEPVGRLIEAFGLGRCMWGTDWTRTANILTYEQGVSAFRDHWPMSASDRATLMGGTAMRIYARATLPKETD